MADWDRSHDWVVERIERYRAEVTILFNAAQPDIRELMALRRCLEGFRHLPPQEARKLAGTSGRLDLGEMSGIEAHRLVEKLNRAGLRTTTKNKATLTYLPIDRTTRAALLVEDVHEAERIALEMIAAGFPAQDIAAD